MNDIDNIKYFLNKYLDDIKKDLPIEIFSSEKMVLDHFNDWIENFIDVIEYENIMHKCKKISDYGTFPIIMSDLYKKYGIKDYSKVYLIFQYWYKNISHSDMTFYSIDTNKYKEDFINYYFSKIKELEEL